TRIRAELNLAGGVCSEHFVEAKVSLIVGKLGHTRGQVNCAPVADARFDGQARERRDINRAPRQAFDVEAQGLCDQLKRESCAAAPERIVTLPRFERVVTAPRACVRAPRRQSFMRPSLELLDGRRAQSLRRGTQT